MSKEWESIETAPTDGTLILAARNGRHIGLIRWAAGAGWENTLDGEGYALIRDGYAPTHWVDVSDPPKDEVP